MDPPDHRTHRSAVTPVFSLPVERLSHLPPAQMGRHRGAYYIRLMVVDQPGVLASIARILGDARISIASVIQKEIHEASTDAELVIMTHEAREASVQDALKAVQHLPEVREIGNFIRVEEQ